MKTLVYTDYAYHRAEEGVLSERAFSLFLARVAEQLDGPTVIAGRLSGDPTGGHYGIGDAVEFAALPWYGSLASASAVPALLRSLWVGWRLVGSVDRVWLLGPHPLILILALFTRMRRRTLILGVRQDFPAYIASRHPRSRVLRFAAGLLEQAFRGLGRRCAVVVVGPELGRNYSHARALLEIPVSLVSGEEIVDAETAAAKDYSGARAILSVGRLDTEKNPLMLADVVARLVAEGGDWRLEVCGEGPLRDELGAEVERRGLGERVELAGYVPYDGGLVERYRSAHVLLHCSWTEGLPQVLLEAFAAGLPVVASDVGGIAAAVGEAVALFEPGDAAAATAAVGRIADDPSLRAELVGRGREYVSRHTLEIESARVARFLAS